MTSHTPGPWNYSQESADPEWWIVTIKGGLIVANVNAHAHQEANARLVAAAPELLAALDAVLQHCVTAKGFPDKDKGRTEAQQSAYSAARCAIAKAIGTP